MPKILPEKYRNMKTESYETYLTKTLESLDSNFIVKVYKTAGDHDKWSSFLKGTDLRIQLRWKKDVIDEFVVEKEFWYKSNREREDRMHMRDFAHVHIDEIKRVFVESNRKKKNAV
jgi:hypothetical protein